MATENKCDKAESGKHEPNMEALEFECFLGSHEARFQTECVHCGARGETVIHFADFEWIGDL